MKKIVCIICVLFSLSAKAQYKTGENYLIQEVKITGDPAAYRYAFLYGLITCGEFYIANEANIIGFFNKDSVSLDKLTLLFDHKNMFKLKHDSIANMYRLNYAKGIYDILMSDDTEIYKIGN